MLYVKYPECGTLDSVVTVKDNEGNEYKTLRVGCECWLAENLKSSQYSDGNNAEKAAAYQNDASNEENYGKLYSWYTALNVSEGNDSEFPTPDSAGAARGICPKGWAVPSMEDYSNLVSFAGGISKIKSPSTAYWLPGSEGESEGNIGFDARGAGYCDFENDKFFNLKGTTGFWTSDSKANDNKAQVFKLTYFCDSAMPEDNSKSLGYSVRCIRKY